MIQRAVVHCRFVCLTHDSSDCLSETYRGCISKWCILLAFCCALDKCIRTVCRFRQLLISKCARISSLGVFLVYVWYMAAYS